MLNKIGRLFIVCQMRYSLLLNILLAKKKKTTLTKEKSEIQLEVKKSTDENRYLQQNMQKETPHNPSGRFKRDNAAKKWLC